MSACEWRGPGLDKACIDQTVRRCRSVLGRTPPRISPRHPAAQNIDANLASLPIFLAGCKQLLVLAGETYASRLWCVMELFIFVRMGGNRDDIKVSLLADDDLALLLSQFDASKARCFLDGDRQRLLAVIEASFGTTTPFNSVIRGIFNEKLGVAPPQKSSTLKRLTSKKEDPVRV